MPSATASSSIADSTAKEPVASPGARWNVPTPTLSVASRCVVAPLGDQFSVGVRLGVATTKTKFSISARTAQTPTSLSDSTTNTNGVFGVNAQWNPTPRMGVRLEYQRYKEVGGDSDDDIDGFNVTLLSLGVIWKL